VGTAEEIEDPGDEISLRIHHGYSKRGIEDHDAYDRDWLAPGRVVFRVRETDHTSMDQRKVTDQRLLAVNPAEAERLGLGPTRYG
jgi:hypothetical protein